MLEGKKITVVGAGIGGLTAALAFARRGAQVRVFEQAPEITEVGAGLQITPNGARLLDALGLSDAAAMSGLAAQAVVPIDALSGSRIARFDISAQRPCYRFYHRAALVGMLADACRSAGVEITLGARVLAVDIGGTVTTHAGDFNADLCVGADGIHAVSRAVTGRAMPPRFTGQVAWRATVPDTGAAAEARIWMAPRRHVVTYPLAEGLLNIVAVEERQTWAAEGWNHPDDPANLEAAFGDTCAELRGLLAQVTSTNIWGLFRHPVAERWHNGRLAILGDAAHPTLPFLAQGANLAIEDAWVLAACCDAAPLEQALETYQGLRRARVVRAIDTATRNAANYHASGLRRAASHAALRALGRIAPDAFIGRLDWLYGFDATDGQAARSIQTGT